MKILDLNSSEATNCEVWDSSGNNNGKSLLKTRLKLLLNRARHYSIEQLTKREIGQNWRIGQTLDKADKLKSWTKLNKNHKNRQNWMKTIKTDKIGQNWTNWKDGQKWIKTGQN